MKVLIIDNDDAIREGLKKLLLKYCPQVTEISEANGVSSGLENITLVKPDLVFLDVEMNDGTGFDLIQKLEKIDFALIFITAYNKYAVKAFKFSAIDFLEKPIDPLELIVSINKAVEIIEKKSFSNQILVLEESLSQFQNHRKETKKIVLNDGKSMHFVRVSDIVYCKADGAYTEFVFANIKSILISKNLKEYEELLSDYGFYRTHHSILVNLAKVERFDKGNVGNLILEGNIYVPVSTRKKEALMRLLDNIGLHL